MQFCEFALQPGRGHHHEGQATDHRVVPVDVGTKCEAHMTLRDMKNQRLGEEMEGEDEDMELARAVELSLEGA